MTVGSLGCLQAVGTECGLIGGECEPRPPRVGVECEPKTALVCEPIAYCLQPAIVNGVLVSASRVERDREVIEGSERIAHDFPRDEQGQVQW